MKPYLLDNAADQAPARLAALSAMFDATTMRHLEARGVASGWSCLEIGGGSGTIAAWLADRVGPGGRVLVTDIDPRHLAGIASDRSNLFVQQHDITVDPLPEATFDLIHVRLVLVHLPEWEQVLRKLRAALKPGGWLVDEEFDSDSMPPDPSVNAGEARLETHVAMGRLMASRGFDRRYGRRLYSRLRMQGFESVGAEARAMMIDRDSPGTQLVRANYEQLRADMIAAGYVTADAIDADLARLDDADFVMPSSVLWTAWGRKPIART
jgi:ubiquinone/menaquinone biosynthesis C-methylase UbiE